MRDLKNNWMLNKPIAHRGLFDENSPENTAPAFQAAIDNGYAIEMDVQMTLDGVLVVYHDNNLLRICGVDKDIRDITYDEVKTLRPLGKEYPIMTFSEFLTFVDGKTPLLVEVKAQKQKGIEEKVVNELRNYKGEFAVQSFNPFIVKRMNKIAPEFYCGVLCEKVEWPNIPWIMRKFMFALGFKLFLKFDFLTIRVADLGYYQKKAKKYQVVTWTLKDEKDILTAEKYDYAKNIIFEKTVPTLGKFGEKKW